MDAFLSCKIDLSQTDHKTPPYTGLSSRRLPPEGSYPVEAILTRTARPEASVTIRNYTGNFVAPQDANLESRVLGHCLSIVQSSSGMLERLLKVVFVRNLLASRKEETI